MDYLLTKTPKLRMAGCTDNDELVARVWEGMRDAPRLFLTMADKKNSTLAVFHQYLQDVQEIKEEEYRKRYRPKKKTPKQKRHLADEYNTRSRDRDRGDLIVTCRLLKPRIRPKDIGSPRHTLAMPPAKALASTRTPLKMTRRRRDTSPLKPSLVDGATRLLTRQTAFTVMSLMKDTNW